MPIELVALLVIAAFALMILGGIAYQKNIDRDAVKEVEDKSRLLESHWVDVARRTGLRLVRKSPYGLALHGVLDGTPVWFGQFAIVDGRDRWWGIRAELPQHAVKMTVAPADKAVGGAWEHTIPTGDDEFDLVYKVHANDAVEAFHAISRPARQALLALGPAHLTVGPGVMELTVPFEPTELDDARIVSALELVRALALPPPPRAQLVN
ncbi:MAG: hypothetical protein JNK05_34610 [Myxococcales bacterium]|nr:hypothetical protein [Myxococcales bacterium]